MPIRSSKIHSRLISLYEWILQRIGVFSRLAVTGFLVAQNVAVREREE